MSRIRVNDPGLQVNTGYQLTEEVEAALDRKRKLLDTLPQAILQCDETIQ